MSAAPPPGRTSWEVPAAIVLVLVAGAIAVGAVAGVRGRAAPAPTASAPFAVVPLPTPTPLDPAEVERRAFAQPLVAGCATERAVWIVADGGAAIRFDGTAWSSPDQTLRSLHAVACGPAAVLAVGAGGSIVRVDDERRTVHVDRSGVEDLFGLALLPDGALAVGTRGTVLRQSAADWTRIDAGIVVDLDAVAVSGTTGWLAGGRGATYRVEGSATRTAPSGTTETIRSVAMLTPASAVAAGDGGTLIRWDGSRWAPLATGGTSALRSVALVGDTIWAVGDGGTVLNLRNAETHRVDLGTSCTLRSVFPQGATTWIVGSDGLHAAAWRIGPGHTDHWGSC
jgi:hypothetical protein